MHLTNNCLQKYGTSYGKHEDGNTLSFDDFQAYLDEILPDLGLNVEEHFVARIKDLVIDTFLSVKDEFNPKKRKHCFEVFGYDFMIDEDFRTWLIEVNSNPYFGIPNHYIRELLPRMVDEMLSLVLDPVYGPKRDFKEYLH